MGKKILIAAGTAHYDHLPADLQRPGLTKVVESVAGLFTGDLGYTRVLEEISNDPTSSDLVRALDRWFASPDREGSDWVVFYYTGHGELDGDSLVLLTRDSEDGLIPSTSVSAERLGQILMSKGKSGEKRRTKNCFLILDTCHSGAGAFDIIGKLRKFFNEGDPGLFYVLAAALPREEAMAGKLANALIASINDESLGGAYQRLLYPEQLRAAINRRLKPDRFLYSSLGSSDDEPEFFSNPRYIPDLPSGATVADVRRAAEFVDLHAFWGPRSRGVELEQQPGWYFTGRVRALDELGEWLRAPSDFRTRVVTGNAGSGKSAILSKLVTLSDPDYRRRVPVWEEHWLHAVPAGIIDVAVHAKGKTVEEITSRVATRLGIENDRSKVLASIAESKKSLSMVIDALDEASEPARVVRELLVPLSSLPNVKLLVGTRPEFAKKLGSAVPIRVDDAAYLDTNDLAEYVTARLLGKGEGHAQTPYQGRPALAKRVGKAVAERAFPNYLVARLVTENLLASPAPLDDTAIDKSDFPESVAGAFKNYLARFGEEEQKVRDLLTPLAWAEGSGLPWENLWPALATSLGEHSYGDSDIRWLLDRAGLFVVEALEAGRSVYRLYHQELADTLRQGQNVSECERKIFGTLLHLVPLTQDGKKKDWLAAHPYIRTHLAEHAARGRMLGELLRDAFYLVAANPERLLAVIDSHGSQGSPEVARIYKSAVHHIREKPIAEAASYLEMISRQNGAPEIANQAAQMPLPRPWSVPWANWRPRLPSRPFAKGTGEISVLAAAMWEADRPAALVGRKNGSVEIWDIANGAQLFQTTQEGTELPWCMALTDTSDGPLLVVSWSSGHLGVFDLATGQRVVQPHQEGEHGAAIAICTTQLDGKPVCVTAHRDRRLALWELPELKLVHERRQATGGKTYCLDVISHEGASVIVSGNDSPNDDSDDQDNSKLRLWSLEDLEPIWGDGSSDNDVLRYVEAGMFLGRMLLVTSQDGWGPPEIWDLAERRRLFRADSATTRTWLRTLNGKTLLISASIDGTLTVSQLNASDKDDRLSISVVKDKIPVQGSSFSAIFDLNGRPQFLSSVLDHVRVWDIEELLALNLDGEPSQDNPAVTSLAASESTTGEFYAGTYGKLISFDVATGARRWEKNTNKDVRIQAIALTETGNRVSLVAGDREGIIHVVDTASPASPARCMKTNLNLEVLRTIPYQGQTVILMTVREGGKWSTRMWTLETGKEIPTKKAYSRSYSEQAYSLSLGEEDKTMYGLAVSPVDEGFRFAFSSKYSKVMVADFGRSSGLKTVSRQYEEWYMPGGEGEEVNSLAAGSQGEELLLAAGTAYGHLVVWDFLTGAIKWHYVGAHLGTISVLAFHKVDKRAVLVSGGQDCVLHFWTTRPRDPITIDIGEPIDAIAWVDHSRLAVGTGRGVLIVQFSEKELANLTES